MPVSDSTSVSPLSPEQRKAAQALLRTLTPVLAELGDLFVRAGHELALVGGRVRDVFLGTPPGDLDLTTDAVPEQVLAITRKWADKTWTVGIDFGTIGLRKGDTIVEITTYRSEQYGPRSRKPAVRYGTSLEEDLARRDFTINAMAARLPSYELVDPFGGLAALRERVIRTPGRPEDSFSDDPLRIMRAARFAARLGFSVADDAGARLRSLVARISDDVASGHVVAVRGLERQVRQVERVAVDPIPVLLVAATGKPLGQYGDALVAQEPLVPLEGLAPRCVLGGIPRHLVRDRIEREGLRRLEEHQDKVGDAFEPIELGGGLHRPEPTAASRS